MVARLSKVAKYAATLCIPASGSRASKPRRAGFTLLQMVTVMGIIMILATLTMGMFGRSMAMTGRSQCDTRLKAIAIALDAFRQERGRYPSSLQELKTEKFLQDPDALHCPDDPRRDGSYDDFYVLRSPRESGEMPIVVCPFHEHDGNHGSQAYKGVYTSQFTTQPAALTGAGGATVQHPGEAPLAAVAGMELHGGDRVITSAGGSATIRFADGSTSNLGGGSDVTVLQSFVDGHANAPLYTLIRQTLGMVDYRVNPGSKFDVSTPTATAGALGTEFVITVNNGNGGNNTSLTSGVTGNTSSGTLHVVLHKVYLSTLNHTTIIPEGATVPLNDYTVTATPAATATAVPTPAVTPTTVPTTSPTPTPTPDDKGNHGNGNGNGGGDGSNGKGGGNGNNGNNGV